MACKIIALQMPAMFCFTMKSSGIDTTMKKKTYGPILGPHDSALFYNEGLQIHEQLATAAKIKN
jgi:hypothetical protein